MKLTVRNMVALPSESKPDLPYGAYTRIARRVRPQVTPQHVREVYLGRRPSKRIEAAIARYIAQHEQAQSAA